MRRFSWLILYSLALLQASPVCALAPSQYFQKLPFTRRDLSVGQVQRELGAILAKNSTIFGPKDPRWEDATARFSTFAVPDVEVVVVPGVEKDVSTIVKYCNANSIEFYPVNRAHGWTSDVGSFKGLLIDLGALNKIEIEPDQKSAWFQGGTYSGMVVEYLWGKGFATATAATDCVGMIGPGLGGGHGRFDGLHGLVGDNIISLNVVLANGKAVKVDKSNYADLFWAMNGAGHNFGIVTSFQSKIYPGGDETWHYHNYVWTGDKLEEVFSELNKFHNNGSTPVKMAINFGVFAKEPSISKTEAIMSWSFTYAGPAEEAEKYLVPFNKIKAISSSSGDVTYDQLSNAQGTSINSSFCVPNKKHIQSTAGLMVYNVTATRQIYSLYNEYTNKYPELVASLLHDGYSTEAVKKLPAADSAVPYRAYNHLTFFDVEIPAGSGLEKVGRQFADGIKKLWNDGQPGILPSVYVNYASGHEDLGDVYGHEKWRLERLRKLKAKYDPHNHFRFYNPIIRN